MEMPIAVGEGRVLSGVEARADPEGLKVGEGPVEDLG
jgi:hypothetical protein